MTYISALALSVALSTHAVARQVTFHIPAEGADKAIQAFMQQTGVRIVAPANVLRGVRTTAVEGAVGPREALGRMLQGTGVEIAKDDGQVITLRRAAPVQTANAAAPAESPSSGTAVSEILVKGNRTLDVDIRRTRDDIQPYVVFNSDQIAHSGAQNIEDFLQTQLPMNAQQTTLSQLGPSVSPQGRIDLRGLGSDQTLILVDGRRLPSVSTGDSFGQPNINGISMAQIDRIEILPATASGIYGGGATGGVINIILKRNYSGLDLDVGYGNTFDNAADQYHVAVNGGFSLEGDRTHVMFSVSHSDAGVLMSTQRPFATRGAQLQLRNDPTQPSVLYGGANLCATVDDQTCSTQPLALNSGAVLSSPFASIPRGYAGPASDGGAALAANSGRLQFGGDGVPIWSAPEITTYNIDVRRKFTDRVEAFVDFSRDESDTTVSTPTQQTELVPAGSPANPFQQDVLSFISIPGGIEQRQTVTNTRINAGVIVQLPYGWSASAEYDWLRDATFASNSSNLGSASPDADLMLQAASMRDLGAFPLSDPNSLFSLYTQRTPISDTLQIGSLRLSGPVVKLPGGDVTATALIERRYETSDESVAFSSIGGFPQYLWNPEAKRTTQSEYLELRAPLISPSNTVPLVSSLELMASVRHDDYSTDYSGSSIGIPAANGPFPSEPVSVNKASATDFTVGFNYAPTPDLAFRASYSTGFLPPNLSQIQQAAPSLLGSYVIGLLDLRDPQRGNELIPGPLTVLGGGNASLKPEESKSASAGIVLTPRIAKGLRISIDYTSIDKSNEVVTEPLSFFLANESDFTSKVVRGPNLPGDAPGEPGPITQIDDSALNLASTKLRALDFQADYTVSTDKLGEWRFYVVATNTLALKRQVLASEGMVDRVGYADGPLKWRGNVGIDWSRGALSAGWNMQYYDSYHVCSSTLDQFDCQQEKLWQGSDRIPSQIYNDIYIKYNFPNDRGPLHGVNISLTINNIFNNAGPTIASGVTYANGPASFSDPRLRRFTLNLHKHF